MSSILTIKLGSRKYPMPLTEKALLKVGKMWRKNARISLRMQDRVNSGALYDSMPVDVRETPNTYEIDITPQVPYWKFVDKGVQGATRNIFPKQSESPFKFGSGNGPKGGLRKAIDKWVAKKGFQFQSRAEGSKGQWLSFKATAFLVSRSIWNRGLKPILFITGTGKRIRKHVVKTIAPAMSRDTANALRKDLAMDKNLDVK